jgi:uncharacterized damage-inducible protein DinB
MPETPERLSERLLTEGHKTLDFFRHLSPEQWDLGIYSEGSGWAIQQLLAHFVATEAAFTRLIESVLAGGPGSPEGFDIDAYNERKVAQLRQASKDELLERFFELRQASASLVAAMTAEDLQKKGRHPYLGVAPLEDIVKLLYRHNQLHQRDVRRKLS